MIVTESTNYNVILGNQWISLVNGILDYNKGLFSYEQDGERDYIMMTCWQRFIDPKILYEIEPIAKVKDYELEIEDDELEDMGRIFLNRQEAKEQRFLKAQIEKDDIILSIVDDKRQ